MNYTKEQILDKSKKIFSDLLGDFFNEKNIENILFDKEDEVLRPKKSIIPAWTIAINEPVFESTNFLIISDQTGEPLYIQSSHKVEELTKDSNGKYIRKE